MSSERGFKISLHAVKLKGWLKKMKLIPKLTLSYIITVVLCILIVGGFYYVMLQNNIRSQTAELFNNTMLQARENIEYKVELYNSLAELMYMNRKMQELLFKEYYDVISRSLALNDVMYFILPLTDGYKDITQFSLYVVNDTLVPFENYIQSIKTLYKNEVFEDLSQRNDSTQWFLYDEVSLKNENGTVPPVGDAFSENRPRADVVTNLVLVKNLRYLPRGKYLGALMIKLDRERLFGGLNSGAGNLEGWFDIVNSRGEMVYNGGANESLQNEGETKNDIRAVQDNYKQLVVGSETQVSLDVGKRKFLVLKQKIDQTDWTLVYANPMDRYQGDFKQLQMLTFILVLLCLAIFVMLSWLMAMKFSKRIRVLSHSMKLVQHGDFEVRIKAGDGDEIDDLGNGFNRMALELKNMVDEVWNVKEREKQAELKALQAQINPHFLYNTLASISYMGADYGAVEVTNMSNSLAKFYRISLSKGNNIITIYDELEHVKAYMEIQNVRFKNRIRIVYDVDEHVLEGRSPKLLLQPFVENAIMHGMWVDKKHITIRIVIREVKGQVCWKVIDDGVGMPKEKLLSLAETEKPGTHGYGIANVDQRIKVVFGDQYGVTVFSRPGIGTVVTIETSLSIKHGSAI